MIVLLNRWHRTEALWSVTSCFSLFSQREHIKVTCTVFIVSLLVSGVLQKKYILTGRFSTVDLHRMAVFRKQLRSRLRTERNMRTMRNEADNRPTNNIVSSQTKILKGQSALIENSWELSEETRNNHLHLVYNKTGIKSTQNRFITRSKLNDLYLFSSFAWDSRVSNHKDHLDDGGCKDNPLSTTNVRDQNLKTSLGWVFLCKTLHSSFLKTNVTFMMKTKHHTAETPRHILFSAVMNQRTAFLTMPKHTARTNEAQMWCFGNHAVGDSVHTITLCDSSLSWE